MAKNSGNIIKRYIDTNLNSPTFGEEKVMVFEDTLHCPIDGIPAEWVEVSREPELVEYYPSGVEGFDGYAIVTYKDVNPESHTYGKTRTDRVKDDNYPRPNTNPQWELTTTYCARYDYCEIDDAIPEEDINNLFNK